MITGQSWPEFDPDKCKDDLVEIAIQINGKIRARMDVQSVATSEQLIELAKSHGEIAAMLAGKTIIKEICVPGKLCNFVVK